MDVDGLAQSAVEVVAQQLAQRGADAAGRLADAGVDRIYQLIAARLRRSPAGQSMLTWFHQNPADEQSRWQLTAAVTGEVRHDPEFAHLLGQAVGQARIVVQGAGASYRAMDNSGDFRNISAGRDVQVKQRQFHIGRLQFGTGGLVTGVIGLVVLLGGGTVAVVQATTDQTTQASLKSVVGSWERPGEQPLSGFEVSPTVLTIQPDGRFTFSVGIQMGFPAEQAPPGGFPGINSININCSGTVEPVEDRFTLRATTGQCGTFEAKLSPDGSILDVFLSGGSADGSTALTKVDS